MGLSETIIAAMIGAAATISAAIFQLSLALRSRKADSKPRKGSGLRSLVAVFAIVLGAAVAGFAYSELRSANARETTLALQQRLTEELDAFATSRKQLELLRNGPSSLDPSILLASNLDGTAGRSEAIVQVAACRSDMTTPGSHAPGCDFEHGNRLALCAKVPARAAVLDVLLYAHAIGPQQDWEQSRVTVDQDVERARFVDRAFELEQGSDSKAVCSSFVQWNSEQGHVARIVVLYATGASHETSPGPAVMSEPSRSAGATPPTTIVATETQTAVATDAAKQAVGLPQQ